MSALHKINKNRKGENPLSKGYVYILANASYEKLLKIGCTSKNPKERADELSAHTGVASPFLVIHERFVTNYVDAERAIHQELEEYRYQKKREFFSLSVKKAISVFDKIADRFTEKDEPEKLLKLQANQIDPRIKSDRSNDISLQSGRYINKNQSVWRPKVKRSRWD